VKVEVRKSFVKDLSKLPKQILPQINGIINQIEKAVRISEIHSCKKLSGFNNVYPIRVGSCRMGIYVENGVVELVRILSRKDIYKFFP
jgi:mRNA interferase RelE/StbE